MDAMRKKLAKFEHKSMLKIARSTGYFQIQAKEYLVSDQNSVNEYFWSLIVSPRFALMLLDAYRGPSPDRDCAIKGITGASP